MSRNQIYTLLAAFYAFVVLGLFDGLIGVAWPSIRDEFAQINSALGTLLAVMLITYIVAGLINGKLIQRFGLFKLLIMSALFLILGGALQFSAPNWPALLAAGVILGAGKGLLESGLNTYAAEYFKPRFMHWLHAFFGLGTALGALMMTGLISLESTWQVGLMAIAASYACLLLLLLWGGNTWEYHRERVDQPVLILASNRETLKLKAMWYSLVLFFLSVAIEVGFAFWIFTILTESRMIEPTTAGFWTSLYLASYTLGRIFYGCFDFNLSRLTRLNLLFTLIGALMIAVNLTDTVTLLGLLLSGVGVSALYPAWISLTPQRLGRAHAANAIGYQVGISGLSGVLAPLFMGMLATQVGLESITWLIVCIALLAFIFNEIIEQFNLH